MGRAYQVLIRYKIICVGVIYIGLGPNMYFYARVHLYCIYYFLNLVTHDSMLTVSVIR